MNELQIEEDKKFDGFKAISTSTKLPVVEILEKYSDLFEVEHAFRALKSTIEIRPMFHWTDQRIEAHVLMCFIAYQFLNHLKNQTGESYQKINSILDKMQLSVIEQDGELLPIYMRSALNEDTILFANKLKIQLPHDIMTQHAINEYFK